MAKDALQLPGGQVFGPEDFMGVEVLDAEQGFRGKRNNCQQGVGWRLPKNDAEASQPSEGENANNVHGQIRAMSPERNPVGVVTGERESKVDGFVSTGVSGSEKDLSPVPSLESSAYNAGDIVPPGDVIDLVGVSGVAGHRAGVNGPFGTEASVQYGGVPLYRPKVQGMEAVSIIRWEDEIPSELLQVVEAQRKESCIVAVNLPVGKGRSQNKQGKPRTSVAVGCAYVPGPEGGKSRDCLFVGSGSSVRQREVKEGGPAWGAGAD